MIGILLKTIQLMIAIMKTVNMKKLLSDFTAQQNSYSKEVDDLFAGVYQDSSKQFTCTLNAVEKVILPLFSALKTWFPQLHIPDKGYYGLNGGYYKMKIGKLCYRWILLSSERSKVSYLHTF